jgi:hypothetical protein
MLSRSLYPLLLLTIVVSACGTSESGEAPDPVSSGPDPTSAAGAAALSSDPIDPLTCHGVLGRPPETHTLALQSLTDSGKAGNEQIDSMCAAGYETSVPGDPFLTVALIEFDSDGPAADHYELLKSSFVAEGITVSEVDSADDGPLDWVSALIERDGIGRITVMRQMNWVMSVSVGPTATDSPWTSTDMRTIGESIINRAQR